MARFHVRYGRSHAAGYDADLPQAIEQIHLDTMQDVEGVCYANPDGTVFTTFFDTSKIVDITILLVDDVRAEVVAYAPEKELAIAAADRVRGVIPQDRESTLEKRVKSEEVLAGTDRMAVRLMDVLNLEWSAAWALPRYAAFLTKRQHMTEKASMHFAAKRFAPEYAHLFRY